MKTEYKIRKNKTTCGVVIWKIDKKELKELWKTKQPLYALSDDELENQITLTLLQMQNIARRFDAIIKREVEFKELKTGD